ncbi:MAG: outer membrane protein OmpA-like peptidoglycan-associated protein [Crocinitomix sp.]
MDSISGGQIQRKIKIGEPNDKFEVEADQMADKVMRMPEVGEPANTARGTKPAIQRKCEGCESEETTTEELQAPGVQAKEMDVSSANDENIQPKYKDSLRHIVDARNPTIQMKPSIHSVRIFRKEEDEDIVQKKGNENSGRGPPMGDFSSKLSQSKGSGQAMDSGTNSFMSSRFGADFSNVKIHTGSEAANMSSSISAKAFTHQNHVYFNQGQYQPSSNEGKTLLAHELTHTIQQGAVGQNVQRACSSCDEEKVQPKLEIGAPNDKFEQEADATAERVMRSAEMSGGQNNSNQTLSHTNHSIIQRADECGPGVHNHWGGFYIEGDCDFVKAVRADLNLLNATTLGRRILDWQTYSRSSWYNNYVRISETSVSPGFIPYFIHYNPGWTPRNDCRGSSLWTAVPTYVYLFHEIVHLWLYESEGLGTHDERECMATGLGTYFNSLDYNENKLRCELGLPIRPCYGNVCPQHVAPTCDVEAGSDSEVQPKLNSENKTNKALFGPNGLEQSENIQRKSWEKEEEYNPYLTLKETVQRKCESCQEEVIQPKYNSTLTRGPPGKQSSVGGQTNSISADSSGKIRRGFWDDPLGSIGGAISDAASAVADSLNAGIDLIKGKVSSMAAKMPGYKLFTVVVAKDPISGKSVDRSGRNFIEAGLDLIPDGSDYKNKMIKDGGMDEAAKWLDNQMKLLNFSVTDIIADFGRFISSLSMSDVTSPTAALNRGIKIFKPYVDKVLAFAKSVAIKCLAIVKSLAIDALLEWIKKKTTLYPLLTLVLGSDPLTGNKIDRNGDNILRAVILLQSDGQTQITKMEKNGALAEGALWIDDTLKALVGILGDLTAAFTTTWKEFKITDLLKPTETFTKIYDRFSKPVLDIKNFIVRVGAKILQIVRDIVVNELLGWVKTQTPWYPLVTVVLGEDPITGKPVKRNGMNLIKGFAALHPEGEAQVKQMEESGSLQKAASWIDTSIVRIIGIIAGLKKGFTSLWTTFSVTDLLYPVETFKTIYTLFSEPVSEMISFAIEVAIMILKFIKEALIARLIKFAKTIPGYNLVTVIMGKDVFSQEPVERSAENIIRGFMGLIPGGEEKFQEMKQTGVIGEAIAWIEGAIEELDLTWEMVRGLFTRAWNEFSLSDLAKPIETFGRLMDLFAAPIGRLIRFVGKVVIKLVEIALRLMGFPFALIGSIISRAQTAFEEIKNDPIGFLKNILKAVKQGFVQFFGNILTHLLKGVGDWLFGQLGDTGITIPTDFSFKSILGLVFEILGITKEKIFEKLKKKVGPERWERIEGMMDKAMGVWSFVKDIMERGPIVIWEKIQEKLSGLWEMVISAAKNWIMTKIIEQVSVKLLSLLDPTGIMAVVNSFIAFFKAVQSAIEYMIPMLEMLNSFLGGVVQIAQGNIKPAADLLESTMARGMPILIGFLANQVGLGSIGKKIKEIIGGIQAKVDEGIQWMIDKAWEIGAKMLEAGKGLLKKGLSKKGKETEKKGAAGDVWRMLEVICEKKVVDESTIKKVTTDQTNKEKKEGTKYSILKQGKKWYIEAKGKKGSSKSGAGTILSSKANKLFFTTNQEILGIGDRIIDKSKVVLTKPMGKTKSGGKENETKKYYNAKVEQAKKAEKEGQAALDSKIAGVNFKIKLEKFDDVEKDKKITVDFLVEPNKTDKREYLNVTDLTQIGLYIFYKAGSRPERPPHVIIKTQTSKDESSAQHSQLMVNELSKKKMDAKLDGWLFSANDYGSSNKWQEEFTKFALKNGVTSYISGDSFSGAYQDFIPVSEEKTEKAKTFQKGQIKSSARPYTATYNCVTHAAEVVQAAGVALPGGIQHLETSFANAVLQHVENCYSKNIGLLVGKWEKGKKRHNPDYYDPEPYVAINKKNEVKDLRDNVRNYFANVECESINAKLRNTKQTSPEELEADNIAAQIVSSPVDGKLNPSGRSVQRKIKSSDKRVANNNPKKLSSSAGRRMDRKTQSFMEKGFGADFSNVRIHSDTGAAQKSEAIQARAFATGNDIYFNSGEYQPNSQTGKRLLAHELTHTIQQGASKPSIQRQAKPGEASKSEAELKPKVDGEKKPKEEVKSKTKTETELKTPTKPATPAKSKVKSVKAPPTPYDEVTENVMKDRKGGAKLKPWKGKETADFISREFVRYHSGSKPFILRGNGVKKKELNLEVTDIVKKIKQMYPMIKKSLNPKKVNKDVKIMKRDKTKLDPALTRRLLTRLIMKSTGLGHYAHATTDPTFIEMLDNLLKIERIKRMAENFAINQSGYTEKKGKATVFINEAVKKTDRPGLLIHELMHYFADPKFDKWLLETNSPPYYAEGFAEYVTRPIAKELGVKRTKYSGHLTVVRKNIAKHIPHSDMLLAYFAGEVWRLEHESTVAKETFKEQIKQNSESTGATEKRGSKRSKGFSQKKSPSQFSFMNFQMESARLKRQHKNEFTAVLAGVKSNKKPYTLSFVGHANDHKTKAENLKLSIERAKNFNKYAKSKGVDIKQIKNFNKPKGEGEANPIAGSKNGIGRAFNRRVDLTVT